MRRATYEPALPITLALESKSVIIEHTSCDYSKAGIEASITYDTEEGINAYSVNLRMCQQTQSQ